MPYNKCRILYHKKLTELLILSFKKQEVNLNCRRVDERQEHRKLSLKRDGPSPDTDAFERNASILRAVIVALRNPK